MTYVPAELRTQVIARALESCEYCLVHADYAVLTHEIDHVIAEKHGGVTTVENLAYACAHAPNSIGSRAVTSPPSILKPVKLLRYLIHARKSGKIIFAMTLPSSSRSLQRGAPRRDCCN